MKDAMYQETLTMLNQRLEKHPNSKSNQEALLQLIRDKSQYDKLEMLNEYQTRINSQTIVNNMCVHNSFINHQLPFSSVSPNIATEPEYNIEPNTPSIAKNGCHLFYS
jgi:hypothetical protein